MAELGRLDEALAAVLTLGGPDAAQGICRACVDWLPVTGASITAMTGADLQEPVGASDPVAERIDELQFSLGEGPCVEAFNSGRAVLISDIAEVHDARWPMFAAAAREMPVRGMYLFPLQLGGSRFGVLDCHRDTPGSLDRDEVAGALRAVDAAVWTLLGPHEERLPPGGDPWPGWPRRSPLHRAEVHQATGMISVQLGAGIAVALSRLRGAAFAAGRPIDDVARDVVARRLRFDDEDRP